MIDQFFRLISPWKHYYIEAVFPVLYSIPAPGPTFIPACYIKCFVLFIDEMFRLPMNWMVRKWDASEGIVTPPPTTSTKRWHKTTCMFLSKSIYNKNCSYTDRLDTPGFHYIYKLYVDTKDISGSRIAMFWTIILRSTVLIYNIVHVNIYIDKYIV